MHVFTMNYIKIVTLAKQPTKITKREEKNHHPKTKSDRVKVISIRISVSTIIVVVVISFLCACSMHSECRVNCIEKKLDFEMFFFCSALM